jgi:hypothetical protein
VRGWEKERKAGSKKASSCGYDGVGMMDRKEDALKESICL